MIVGFSFYGCESSDALVEVYRVSVLGVQMGEATDETLDFLQRHYYNDRELMRAVVQETNRRSCLL